ncbi:MAG: hypothetical protein ACI4AL_02760 [Aristaeellaceae bacterium]
MSFRFCLALSAACTAMRQSVCSGILWILSRARLPSVTRLFCVTEFSDEREIARVVWLHNTLEVDDFWVSESLLDQVTKIPDVSIIGEPAEVVFDCNGNVSGFQ